MDAGSLITIGISVVFSFSALYLSDKANRTAEKNKEYQVVADIYREYSSVEMLHAIRRLWDFYRKIKQDLGHKKIDDEDLNPTQIREIIKNIREAYSDKKKDEIKEIEKLDPELQLDREKATLHNQRRRVSKFYQFLAVIHDSDIVPKDILFNYWSYKDVRIIDRILLPIEDELREEAGWSKFEIHPSLKMMEDFYNLFEPPGDKEES